MNFSAVDIFLRKRHHIVKPVFQRYFSCCQISLKNTSASSKRWMKRHLADLYVQNATIDGYRCRSAYKLIDINKKFNFLKPGKVVIDCGACPGSWTQVAVKNVCDFEGTRNKRPGLVIGIDLLDIKDINGAILLSQHDFTSKLTQEKILEILPDGKADVILSDMSPNNCGNHQINHEAILDLVESVYDFGLDVLVNGGTFVCKLFDGRGTQEFMDHIKDNFARVKRHKPLASRKESSEIYVYADGFRK